MWATEKIHNQAANCVNGACKRCKQGLKAECGRGANKCQSSSPTTKQVTRAAAPVGGGPQAQTVRCPILAFQSRRVIDIGEQDRQRQRKDERMQRPGASLLERAALARRAPCAPAVGECAHASAGALLAVHYVTASIGRGCGSDADRRAIRTTRAQS